MNIHNRNKLNEYGWNEFWELAWQTAGLSGDNGLQPARVTAQFSHAYRIVSAAGERLATVTGKFEFAAAGKSDFPAVGDWVAAELADGERAVIHALLPRRSAMTRRAAGNREEEQVIGANLDFLFIVNALNEDFNLRRIERYLIMAWESGASPVVLLTKMDLCPDWEEKAAEVESVAPGVPVHAVSAAENRGKEQLAPYLLPGRTVAVTGMSGVGKSTLLNWLAEDDLQRVQGIREDDARGRHTTTHRELFLLPSGALLMDTPGMRELQLWEARDGWQEAFSDIAELAAKCRFRDCRHQSEAGCAVREALESGELDPKRYANYGKTERELARLARKEQTAAGRRQRAGGGKPDRFGKKGRAASRGSLSEFESD
ncbi:ribosome small subunit-dependent GTPase A [Cohnella sp. CFH 77786]|uniref:ribosome small subunit-dependent GTPase A n=1 Tax=Cohnella sp. CFH 77786 TaxID=2662265 RepID=UPI001C608130|nr:ribosome small subunit-dependent GTPase A [Cohnella sp. CFH 77786]MBW5446873.1 ribosome small subunit-dependent GTPase A [Cohnella sp. CFH 77786]